MNSLAILDTNSSLWLVGIAFLTACFLLWRWFALKPSAQADSESEALERDRENLRAYQQAEKDFNQQLANGELSDASYNALLEEAQQELLGTVSEQTTRSASATTNQAASLLTVVAVLLVLMLSALWIYLPVGLSLGATDQASIALQLKELRESEDRDTWQFTARKLDAQLEDMLDRQSWNMEQEQMALLHAQISAGLGNHEKAFTRYSRLLESNSDDPFLMITAVESEYILRSSEQKKPLFTSAMQGTIDKALKINSDIPLALSLQGTAAFEQGNYGAAIDSWRRAERLFPSNSSSAQQIRMGIDAALSRLSGAGNSSQLSRQTSTNQESQAKAYIDIQLDIDRSLLNETDNGDTTVFVFARPVGGPRMPLAARKLSLRDLPLKFRLTEADRMAAASILDHDQVEIAARLSRSGAPVGAPGDLESKTLVTTVSKASQNKMDGENMVNITIDQLR